MIAQLDHLLVCKERRFDHQLGDSPSFSALLRLNFGIALIVSDNELQRYICIAIFILDQLKLSKRWPFHQK